MQIAAEVKSEGPPAVSVLAQPSCLSAVDQEQQGSRAAPLFPKGEKMKRLLMVAALAATSTVLPAYAATDGECQAMWTKADTNKDGVLSDAEATRYAAAMRVREAKMLRSISFNGVA